jgi:hypothetical protein
MEKPEIENLVSDSLMSSSYLVILMSRKNIVETEAAASVHPCQWDGVAWR